MPPKKKPQEKEQSLGKTSSQECEEENSNQIFYKVEFTPKANREFFKLPESVQERIASEIDEKLVLNPRPPGCTKLKGMENTYRIKVGDYRVLYEIYDSKLIVLVIDVDHRREVYKKK